MARGIRDMKNSTERMPAFLGQMILVTVAVDEKQKAKAWYRALGHVCAGTGFVMILSIAGALIAWVWQ